MPSGMKLSALVGFGLGLVIFVAPVIAAPAPGADDEAEGMRDAQIDGVVYDIVQIRGKTVLVVYDTDIRDSVDVYLVNPALLPLVQSKTACVGRYVVANGVRTSEYTLDAQGLWIDTTRACGQPPK